MVTLAGEEPGRSEKFHFLFFLKVSVGREGPGRLEPWLRLERPGRPELI